jgi:acyl carrier protein
MALRAQIVAQFERVAEEQDKKLVELFDQTPLLETGLDSLCFAIIVARLEDELGCDPFSDALSFPLTFGDFVRLYENAAQ